MDVLELLEVEIVWCILIGFVKGKIIKLVEIRWLNIIKWFVELEEFV